VYSLLFEFTEWNDEKQEEKRLLGSNQDFQKKTAVYSGLRGHALAQLVGALRYKPEGRGFDSRWCYWNILST
jgi:hypothetical protein